MAEEVPAKRPALDETTDLARAARDDPERFQELCERLAPALYAWASFRILPAMRARLDPQDAVQEMWLRALKIFDQYDPERSPFRPWMFRVAKNVLLEAFRGLRSSANVGANVGPTTKLFLLDACPESITSFTTQLARDESMQRFLDGAQELPDEDRSILIHCGLEGLGAEETAQRLGLNRDAVYKRWQRLRAKLRERGASQELLAAAVD